MGKVYGLHRMELKPGVRAEEFEQFVRTSLQQIRAWPGTRFTLLKGDRGENVGAYMLLIENDSMEARDRIVTEDGLTKEGEQWYVEVEPMLQQWRQYTTHVPGMETPFTDYHDLIG